MRFLSSLGVCACVLFSLLVGGCSGTPPATPVTKLITIQAYAIFDDPKPTYIAIEVFDTTTNTWEFHDFKALSWTEEPDESNYVYVVATCFMTTGKRYRVHGLSGPIVRDVTNTYWLIPEEIILHTEDVGVYDGELTVTPFINLSGPSGP